MRLLTIFGVLLIASLGASAQDGCSQIDKTKPLHFISFERMSGEKNRDVQLRLNNNSTCAIVVETWEDPPKRPLSEIIKDSGVCKPAMFLELKDAQHVGMFYGIYYPKGNIIQRYGAGDAITAATLKGARSILFDVPLKYFKEGDELKLNFEYDWQVCRTAQDRYVVLHQELSFYSWFLPRDLFK